MRKYLYFIPLAAFLGLAVFLFSGLFSDPHLHENARLEQPMPAFALADLTDPAKTIAEKDLLGQPYLLNVWGVWCPTCNAELGFLTSLRAQGVKIVGLYYNQPTDSAFGESFDLPSLQRDVAEKLGEQGDPYQFNILYKERSLIFDLGVTGAPETFIVDAKGKIRHHMVGDINPSNWPALNAIYQQLQQEASQGATP